MADYDVFNGDADGICALTQLRLAEPRDATLITGVKRDIDLLKQVSAKAGDRVTVLDVSMEKNTGPLRDILAAGADVFYSDHHVAGDIPDFPNLTTVISEAPDVCTSLLVNGWLKGKFSAWAVVGAFGDNLRKSALVAAKGLNLSQERLDQLDELGTLINYNGYGEKIEDLHFAPAELFRHVSRFADPFDFIEGDGRDTFVTLQTGYREDMAAAAAVAPQLATASAAVYILPDAPWARRVSGVFSNDLVNQHPDRAHAVLTEKRSGTYLVSVRAPLTNKQGAADLCKQFPTGGGRAAAAGINDLAAADLDRFIEALQQTYAR